MKPGAGIRAFARSTMTSTALVREVVGETTDEFGRVVDVYEDRFVGPCAIWPEDRSQEVEGGSSTFRVSRHKVTFPTGANIDVGYTLTITATPDNAELLTKTWRIVDAPVNAWDVAQECVAESVAT